MVVQGRGGRNLPHAGVYVWDGSLGAEEGGPAVLSDGSASCDGLPVLGDDGHLVVGCVSNVPYPSSPSPCHSGMPFRFPHL